MIRGTTPTHTFTVPFDTAIITDLRISYAQNDKKILTKEYSDCKCEGNTITLILSQEDTLLFSCYRGTIQIQLKVKTLDGKVLMTPIMVEDVEKCIDEEVI